MIRRLIAAMLACAALSASGQSTPAANYTDLWWNPNESGWGMAITQQSSTMFLAFLVLLFLDSQKMKASIH